MLTYAIGRCSIEISSWTGILEMARDAVSSQKLLHVFIFPLKMEQFTTLRRDTCDPICGFTLGMVLGARRATRFESIASDLAHLFNCQLCVALVDSTSLSPTYLTAVASLPCAGAGLQTFLYRVGEVLGLIVCLLKL